jgi:hypothetical protein
VEIMITIKAPELASALTRLADAMQGVQQMQFDAAEPSATPELTATQDVQPDPEPAVSQPEPQKEKPKAEKPKAEEPVTLETVRAQLMALPTHKAKEVVKAFGAPKLTAIPPEKYPEVLARIKAVS